MALFDTKLFVHYEHLRGVFERSHAFHPIRFHETVHLCGHFARELVGATGKPFGLSSSFFRDLFVSSRQQYLGCHLLLHHQFSAHASLIARTSSFGATCGLPINEHKSACRRRTSISPWTAGKSKLSMCRFSGCENLNT